MRRALTIAVLCAVCLAARAPIAIRATSVDHSEVRGLWVVRTALTSSDSINDVVRAAQRGGFNTLFVQVRARGDAFYRSRVEPRSADLAGAPADFDPLATLLARAHAAHLRVHAWVVVNLVSSSVTLSPARTHVIRRHPEWLMVPAPLAKSLSRLSPSSPAYLERLARWTREASDQVEGLFLSPISPASRQYTVSVVTDLVSSYAIDGVHFDYIRYPGANFDYSTAALAAFRDAQLSAVDAPMRARLDNERRMNPAAWADALPAAWESFRRDRLSLLMHALATTVRAARPGIPVSAAVVPRADEARSHRLQDWPRWAAASDLDAICPMAYVTDNQEFRGLVTRARASAGGVPVWAGIGAFRLPAPDVAEQVRIARSAGATGLMIFSFDSIAGVSGPQYLDDLRSAFSGRWP